MPKQKLCLHFNQQILWLVRLQQYKSCSHVSKILFKEQKLRTSLLAGYGTHQFARQTVATSKINHLHFCGSLSANHSEAHPNLCE